MSGAKRWSMDGYALLLGTGILVFVVGMGAVALVLFGPIGAPSTLASTIPSTTVPLATTTAGPTSSIGTATTTTDLGAEEEVPDTAAPPTSILSEADGLGYELFAEGLAQPVAAELVPGTAASFYVLERFGRVVFVEDGVLAEVLDIHDQVNTEGSEQGLVGIALHPEYEQNGRVFLSYVGIDGPLRIVEVSRKPGLHQFDPDERLLLEVAQPWIYHHGGSIQFGPDGMLWIGLGDGGVSNDTVGHAQNPETLQGSLVRIDVDSRSGGLPYGIPSGNAFAGADVGRREIWAYGLRNPWRFTFDEGKVYIADVGQQTWEEINVAYLGEPGSNFGWPDKQGPACYMLVDCSDSPTLDPIVPIPYDGLCAVIGGPVYSGSAIPMFQGQLLWADFCNGFVASIAFDPEGPSITRWSGLGSIQAVTSFAVDAAGEVYVIQASGTMSRIVLNP